MMPVLVKDDYIRSETKAKARHGWLGAAWESLARLTKKPEKEFLAFWGFDRFEFPNLSPRDHILNPLTPRAFCQKCIFWTF